MGNLCTNRLRAEGTKQQLKKLVTKIHNVFESSCEEIDYDEIKSGIVYCDYIIDSSNVFPKDFFIELTKHVENTDGLYIRVSSDEPAMEYLEQSIFRDGKWNFEKPIDINAEIHKLTLQGIEFIRKYLKDKGSFTEIEEDELWTFVYTNDDGDGESAFYSIIELDENDKINIVLTDGMQFGEDELTPNHIMDIITIISNNN